MYHVRAKKEDDGRTAGWFCQVSFTDSSDESASLIKGEELSFLKARGVGKTMENNNWKSCTCAPTANLSSIHEEIKNKV